MTTQLLSPQNEATTLPKPTTIQEGDRTSKFHLTDRDGNICSTHVADDLFNLLSEDTRHSQFLAEQIRQFRQQLQEELSRVVDTLRTWADHHKKLIKTWDFHPCEGMMSNYYRFWFLVTQYGHDYDNVLANELSQLGIQIREELGCERIRVDIFMLPEVSDGELEEMLSAEESKESEHGG